MRTVISVGVVATALGFGLGIGLHAQGIVGSLDKPLVQFTIGDLFPKMADGLRDTASAWKKSGDDTRAASAAQLKRVGDAKPAVKAQVDQAKSEAKAAEKNKDLATAGAAQGRARAGQTVLDMLDRLQSVASTQNELADNWAKTADAMRRFVEADEAFDRYRSNGIAKPETGSADARLDQAGFEALKSRSKALRELGEAFYQLSVKTRNLGDGQMKFADDLQKSGRIR
jgi:hypothetical protein